jgi:hypothetical protein
MRSLGRSEHLPEIQVPDLWYVNKTLLESSGDVQREKFSVARRRDMNDVCGVGRRHIRSQRQLVRLSIHLM